MHHILFIYCNISSHRLTLHAERITHAVILRLACPHQEGSGNPAGFIVVAIFNKIHDLHRKMSMPTSVSVNLSFHQRHRFAGQTQSEIRNVGVVSPASPTLRREFCTNLGFVSRIQRPLIPQGYGAHRFSEDAFALCIHPVSMSRVPAFFVDIVVTNI